MSTLEFCHQICPGHVMSNINTCTLAAGKAAAARDGQSAHRPTDARQGTEVHQGIEKYVLTLFVYIRILVTTVIIINRDGQWIH